LMAASPAISHIGFARINSARQPSRHISDPPRGLPAGTPLSLSWLESLGADLVLDGPSAESNKSATTIVRFAATRATRPRSSAGRSAPVCRASPPSGCLARPTAAHRALYEGPSSGSNFGAGTLVP
jgi:hypothetical protein